MLSLERLRAGTELEAAASKLAQVTERLELTRELHDTLGHALVVVRIEAQLAARLMEDDPGRARQALRVADRRAAEAINQVQDLLGRIGVGAPLPGLSNQVAGQLTQTDLSALAARLEGAGVKVTLVEEGVTRKLAPLASHALYQVVQEALTNVLRHAHAQHAWVKLAWTEDGIRLRVTDDGGGGPLQPGRGILGMAERVESLGGTFELGCAGQSGVTIEAYLPLPLESRPSPLEVQRQ